MEHYFKNWNNFVVRWEKFFLIIFSSISAMNCTTKRHPAIAFNFCVMRSVFPIKKNKRNQNIAHNAQK